MSTASNNAGTVRGRKLAVYAAPAECMAAAGVRIVDQAWISEIEFVTYQGTSAALIDAGLVPAAMFAEVGKSGRKTALFHHRDGRKERVDLAKCRHDRWRLRRRYLNPYPSV